MSTGLVTLFACGDVMPGRGIDQILPHPGDPELREAYAGDANAYVRLAERANGPIPRPAGFSWPWGDALPVLARPHLPSGSSTWRPASPAAPTSPPARPCTTG